MHTPVKLKYFLVYLLSFIFLYFFLNNFFFFFVFLQESLRNVFENAEKIAKNGESCVLLLEDVDVLCARRVRGGGQANRLVAQLLTLLDGVSSISALKPASGDDVAGAKNGVDRRKAGGSSSGAVIVVGTTSHVERLDLALRRPGRLDRQFDVPLPDADERREILQVHTRHLPLEAAVCLSSLAAQTIGFVGADLAALCREAALCATRRVASVGDDSAVQLVTSGDFHVALQHIIPKQRSSAAVKLDKTHTWHAVIGADEAKQLLRQAVEWPVRHADTFRRFNIEPARGILLYGPPGCSKTSLARAAANATQCVFISLDGAAVYSPFLGDAEATIRKVFHQARQTSPAIIFLDEVFFFFCLLLI